MNVNLSSLWKFGAKREKFYCTECACPLGHELQVPYVTVHAKMNYKSAKLLFFIKVEYTVSKAPT